MKKKQLILIFSVLITSCFLLAFAVQPAKATTSTYYLQETLARKLPTLVGR